MDREEFDQLLDQVSEQLDRISEQLNRDEPEPLGYKDEEPSNNQHSVFFSGVLMAKSFLGKHYIQQNPKTLS